MRLEGKAALVTGSSSGIGQAIALRFAREGADVAVHYHHGGDNARRVAAEIAAMGRTSVALGANVGEAAEAERLVREAHEALGRLDILVNNAGVEIREPFLEVSEAHYDLVLGVNLKGAFFAAQAAAKLMIDAGGGGRIVNVSSIHEDVPFLHYSTYTASKGGMRTFAAPSARSSRGTASPSTTSLRVPSRRRSTSAPWATASCCTSCRR